MQSTPNRHRRVATEQDVLSALVALGSLPKRDTEQAELDLAAYHVALDDVSATGLAEAVRRILQGALGHGFFPSPPELRIECDRIARAEASERARLMEERKRREEAATYSPPQHSLEARRRVQAMVDAFHRGLDAPEARRRAEAPMASTGGDQSHV